MGEISTDRVANRRLLVALIAALAFTFLQLTLAHNSSAAAGDPCLQTGMETVATDHPSYTPGELVHISGTGYAADCDIVVKVTRPDGLVVVGDGSGTLGSDTVTSDLFGNFTYDYQLQSMPAIQGTYTIEVLGAAETVLAETTFEDAPKISFTAAPSPVTASSTRVMALEITNTGGSAFNTSDGDNLRCVKATFPAGWTPVSVVGVGTTRSGQSWSASVAGQVVTATATNTTSDQLYKNDVLSIDVSTNTPAANATISAQAWGAQACSGTSDSASSPVTVEPADARTYTASASPTVTSPNTSRTYIVSLTNTAATSQANKASIFIPGGFVVDTSSISAFSIGNTPACGKTNGGWIADGTLFAGGSINVKSTGGGSSGTDLCTNATLNVTFTATSPAVASGTYTWVTQLATGSNGHLLTGPQPTVSIDSTAPSVSSISRADANPTNASSVHWTVTFSEAVTGVDSADFALASSGVSGASISGVTGSGSSYTVTASTGTGNGSLGLNLVDDDSISDAAGNKLGGTGTGNGNFTGQVYSVQKNQAPSETTPSFSPAAPKTNDLLQASTTTSDADGDNVSVAWIWKITRGANTCTIATDSSPSAAAGLRAVTLDLGVSYPTSSCTGGSPPSSINPSKGDVVTVQATPNDGTVDGTTQSNTVTVGNTAPTVAFSIAPSSANEGQTKTYTFTAVDADGDSLSFVSGFPTCGTGGSLLGSPTVAGGTFDCSFPDGPASPTVSVKITDGTDQSNTASQGVSVANVAPTATLSNNGPISEGSSATVSFSSQFDPSSADTAAGFHYAFSCSNGDLSSATYAGSGASSSTSCSYADGPSTRTVKARIIDRDGGFTEYTTSVTVNNVAPTIGISGAASVNEGSSYSLTLGAVSDPGTDTVSSYVVHWGDGQSDTYGTNGAKSHTYADGPNDYSVTVDLVDEDGTFTDRANALSVHINNVAPSITISGAASVNEGLAYSLTLGAVSDPGTDTVSSYVVHWGDGQSDTYTSGGVKGHTYADGPDDHAITVDLVDEDGTFLNRANALSVHVNNVAPSITISGAASVNEGSAYNLTLGAVSDPGTDTVSSYVVHWGDGSSDTYGTNGAKSHTYADGPNDWNVTVDLVDEDGSFLNRANALSVHVNNVAPTATLTGDNQVDEGTTHTYSYVVTDPGQDTFTVDAGYPTCGLYGTLVGTPTTTASGGSFQCSFPDGPKTSHVAIKVTDSDGASDTDSEDVVIVQIANVPPSLTAAGDQSSNEGSSHSFDIGSFTDPGSDADWTVSVDWGDGSFATVFTRSSTGTIPAQTHTYTDGPSDHTVTVTVTDKDGASDSKTFSVHVNNVPPSIAISGDASVNEGSAYSLTLGAVSDPGTDTVSSYVVHWGDGQSDTYSTNGVKKHTYADGPDDHAITVDLVDEDGTFLNRANALSVHVNNVAPTIAISGAASVNEGSSYSLNLGAVTDPGDDTVSSYVVHWGDGSSNTYSSNGVKSHTYADGPNDYDIKVDLVDEDGTFLDAANPLSVHVNNVPPSISISGNASVDEGSPYSLTLGAVSDPGTDTVSSYIVHWGDGSSDTYGTNGAKSHTYADGPNDWNVTVDLVDEDGTFLNRANALSVHVNNVAPTIAISGAASVNEGSAYSLTLGAVTDPGNDTVSSYVVHWGDGSSDTYSTNGAKSHTYADGPNDYNVTVDLVDEDGTFLDRANALSVHVNNVAPTAHLTGPANVDEGSTHTYTFTVSDPGQDTFTVNEPTYPNCGTGGNYVGGSLTTNAGGGSFDCTFPDGPATTNVAIKVTDSDGASDTDSESVQVVNVANVPPNVTAAANQSSDEGENHSFNLGSFTDPGDDSPWTVTVDWGDGSFPLTTFTTNSGGTIPAQSHTYADGPNDYTVTVRVNDGDATTSKTFSVHVNNVPPSIAISGNASVNEGSPYSLTLGAVSDPGTDTVSSYVVHWGDGSSDTYSTNGAKSHTYADGPNDYNVTVDLVDEDGTFLNRANVLSVHINNVAPTINISGAANVNEGSAYSLTLGGVTDPGNDTVSSYIVHWGDGSSDTYSSNGAKSHTYADGPNDYDIKVDLVDEDGTYLDPANPLSVHVNNVPPSITISGAANVNEGSSYSLTLGAVSDPGTDTVSSYVVHWGDGSSDTYGTNGAKSHTYADGPNDYAITVDLVDEDGTFLNRANALSVHVNNAAPSISISGNASVNEGSAYSLTLGAVSDPGTDTVSSYIVHWGDGQSDTYATNGVKTHTYADGPNDYNVTVDLVDEDGTFTDRANALSVHVNNVAPTAHVSGEANVDEGSTHTYTYTVTDPGQDTFTVDPGYPKCGTGGQLVLASVTQNAGGGSFDCFFPNGPATTNVAIKVTDSDGASDTASESVQIVQIANVPPDVTAAASQSSNEGENHSFSLGSFNDPGDDSPWHVTVAWGDASPVTTFDANAAGTIAPQSHTYADGPNDYTVTVSVNDGDDTTSKTFSVHVYNVAPTVTLTGAQSVAEGSTTTYSYTTSDPGSETFSRDAQSCDGGTLSNASFNPANGSGSFDCKWDDAPSSRTPSVTVSDGDGGSDSDSLAVTVNNVAPTATFGNDGPVDEGTSFHLSLTNAHDASAADEAAGFQYKFDCGSGYGSYSGSSSTTCPTNDNGVRNVKATIKDKDGGEREYTASVTVNNVAPTATFSNTGPVNEGQSFTLSLTNPQDPSSADTAAGFQYAFDCGSGSGYGAYGSANSAICPTADNGTRTVKGKIKDKDGGVTEYTGTVTVNNASPVVHITAPSFGSLYAKTASTNPTVNVTASFTDAGSSDTHTCTVSWDDATPNSAGTVAESGGNGTCTKSHTYTSPGVYTIRVTVTDDDGGSGYDETMVVVYDASAGFITGGGWLNALPGSYRPDPTLSGRANFGFNSQYKKNATVPTGSTEFQFQVGNLNFHSELYTWLVVSGFKAQYKGTGTINGAGNYDFTLTAYDGDISGGGGVDKFRIRITDPSNSNAVIFDNRYGTPTDMDVADPQAIAGGSIVIHK